MKKTLLTGLISLTTIGLLLGTFFGNYIADKLFNKDTRVNEGSKYSNAYIAQCDTIQLPYKKIKDTTSYFKVRGHGGSAYVDYDKFLFYVADRKKYFMVMNFSNVSNESMEFFSFMRSNIRDTIIATVNKQELSDRSYGTLQKPVPVLFVRAPKAMYPTFYSIISEKTDRWKGDERQYSTYKLAYNVRHYLGYIKSRTDFDRMFGIQPDKK